jgi:hypothetical protein
MWRFTTPGVGFGLAWCGWNVRPATSFRWGSRFVGRFARRVGKLSSINMWITMFFAVFNISPILDFEGAVTLGACSTTVMAIIHVV